MEKKTSKYNFKAAKAKVKAMNTGSGKKYAEDAKLEMRSSKKYQDAKKFASLIKEVFADSNVSIGDIDPAYISLGKQYGLSMKKS